MTNRGSRQMTLNYPAWIKVWDFFVLLLIIFPFITGGVWISRPGLFIELSDLGIPVLIVTGFAFLLKMSGFKILEQSKTLALGTRLWKKWQSLLERCPRVTLFSAAFIVGTVWSLASLRRHWALGTHTTDLGIYLNGIWNFVFGRGYWSSPNYETFLMPDHQSPSFLLLAPIFRLYPHAETLLVFQAMGLAMGGIALYYLHKQYFARKHWSIDAAPWIYWAYLPIRNAYLSDFHPEVVALAAFLWVMVGFQSTSKRARWLATVGLLYTVGLKEAIPPVVTAIGIAWSLGTGPVATRSFTRKLGLFWIIFGTALLYFDIHWVPHLYGQSHLHGNEYSDFGSGISDVLIAPIRHPIAFIQHLIGPRRPTFLFWTFAPLGFLPLLNPIGLIGALPGYLLLFLANDVGRITVEFHYSIICAIGLFSALPGAIFKAEKLLPIGSNLILIFWLLFWVLGANGRSDLFRVRDFSPTQHEIWLRTQLVPKLNPAVSVSAPNGLVPHIATREYAFTTPEIQDQSGKPISCIILDWSVYNYGWAVEKKDTLPKALTDRGYQKILQCEELSIYELQSSPLKCFSSETPPCFSVREK